MSRTKAGLSGMSGRFVDRCTWLNMGHKAAGKAAHGVSGLGYSYDPESRTRPGPARKGPAWRIDRSMNGQCHGGSRFRDMGRISVIAGRVCGFDVGRSRFRDDRKWSFSDINSRTGDGLSGRLPMTGAAGLMAWRAGAHRIAVPPGRYPLPE